jgi:predicted lipoprotein
MRWLGWLIVVAALTGLCWAFPLFHVVPLKQAAEQKEAGVFNAAQFVEKFWTQTLLKSLDKAVRAEVLLSAIQHDRAAARKAHARQLGLSESYIYFVAGRGRVLKMADDEVYLAIAPGVTNAELLLLTGLVFGNTIRDGTGLLDVNDYPNSQDFNDISAELNKLIETRVLPKLRERAKVGAMVRFAGCAEVVDETSDLQPLKLIPIQAEVE